MADEEWDMFMTQQAKKKPAADDHFGALFGEAAPAAAAEEEDDGSDDSSSSSEESTEEEIIEISQGNETAKSSSKKGKGFIGGKLRGIFRPKEEEDDDPDREKLHEMMHGHKNKFFEPPNDHGCDAPWTLGYVRRYVGLHVTAWHFHKQNGEFLMAASMTSDAKGTCIFSTINNTFRLSSLESIPRKTDSPVYLGQMVYNTTGKEFVVYDYRVTNPKDKKRMKHSVHDVVHISYETNILARVPNSMKVIVARHDEHDQLKANFMTLQERYVAQSKKRALKVKNEEENKSDKVEYGSVAVREQADILSFRTKQPVWNEDLQAWTLNFDGRVKQASKKNFLLEAEDQFHLVSEFGEDSEQLRFGKVRKNVYSLDYRYPFAPIQAFGIALTTFAKKLLVT